MDRAARMTDVAKEKPRRLIDLPLPPEVRQRFQQLSVSHRFTRDPEVVRRILVRVPNWVGDAVMSLPVLAGLRRLFPLAELTVLAAPRVAPLFATQPGVTEIIRYPSGRGKWQVLWEHAGASTWPWPCPTPWSPPWACGWWGCRPGWGMTPTPAASSSRRPCPAMKRWPVCTPSFIFLGLLKALGGVATFTPPTLCLEPEEGPWGPRSCPRPASPARAPGWD